MIKYWLNKKRPEMIGNKYGFQKGHIPWNKGKKREDIEGSKHYRKTFMKSGKNIRTK